MQVSLAFLLCDEINYILERLITAERARLLGSITPVPILAEWVRCQGHGKWENKVVEALCIIQNYQVFDFFFNSLLYHLSHNNIKGKPGKAK